MPCHDLLTDAAYELEAESSFAVSGGPGERAKEQPLRRAWHDWTMCTQSRSKNK